MTTILGVEFEEEDLLQIVQDGMRSGIEGFTYLHQCADKFDEHDDEIQDYLSDWCFDNDLEKCSFTYFAPDAEDITQLKTKLVYAYVELRAQEELSWNKIRDYNQSKRKIKKKLPSITHTMAK